MNIMVYQARVGTLEFSTLKMTSGSLRSHAAGCWQVAFINTRRRALQPNAAST